MNMLKTRMLEIRREEQVTKMGSARKLMVGSGDRSQRIRTYNFPQNRLTDHRINLTLYSLNRVMEGDLAELLETLAQTDSEERVTAELNKI